MQLTLHSLQTTPSRNNIHIVFQKGIQTKVALQPTR